MVSVPRADGDQLVKEGYRSVACAPLRPVESSTIIRIRPASHTVLITVVDGWKANIRHLEDSGQLSLLDIATCAFSEAGNIMTGEKVCNGKLEVGRKMEDRWGRIRIGSQQKPYV